MGVVAHQGPGVDRCPALRGEGAQPEHKSLRSWSSSTMRRLSIPRIITWWSVPGLSSLACRGIAYRLRLCWLFFIRLCPASQQRPVSHLIPRIITWWSVPGLSSLACRGIAYRLRLCWLFFIRLCPASQQRPVSYLEQAFRLSAARRHVPIAPLCDALRDRGHIPADQKLGSVCIAGPWTDRSHFARQVPAGPQPAQDR